VKAGGVLFLGIEGPVLEKEEAKILRRVQPAGIVLVTRNIQSEAQLRVLTSELRAAAPQAIFCLDAEGGRVDRLRNVVAPAPAAADLADCAPALARRSGTLIGAALRELDFDLDFAPVVDLDHGEIGNALDGRTFGATPRKVTARAKAFLDGLHASGVAGCIKHFPGLGRAAADTHNRGASIAASEGELIRDLTPFTDLLNVTDSMMVSHATYPGWDPASIPASLNPAISKALVRGRVGFKRALFSDDLEMGALSGFGSLPELGELALAAGCDGLLFCRRVEQAPAIAAGLVKPALRARLEQALRRLERLKRDLRKLRREAPSNPALETVRRRLAALAAAVSGRRAPSSAG
jgi:beta-N-acetylhexosaminidase